MLDKGFQLARHVVPAVLKPLRSLWNEVIALIFFVLAVPAVTKLVSAFRHYRGTPDHLFEIALTSVWAAVMIYFGFSSIRRARKISRS